MFIKKQYRFSHKQVTYHNYEQIQYVIETQYVRNKMLIKSFTDSG